MLFVTLSYVAFVADSIRTSIGKLKRDIENRFRFYDLRLNYVIMGFKHLTRVFVLRPHIKSNFYFIGNNLYLSEVN